MGQATDQDDPWDLGDPERWPPRDDDAPRARRGARHAGGGHGTRSGSARRIHAILLIFLAPLVAATVAGLVVLWPHGKPPSLAEGLSGPPGQVDATVAESRSQPCDGTKLEEGIFCQDVTVEVTSGPPKGQTVQLQIAKSRDVPVLAAGDAVVLAYAPDEPPSERFVFMDYQRKTPMLVLGGAFLLVLLVFGRLKG